MQLTDSPNIPLDQVNRVSVDSLRLALSIRVLYTKLTVDQGGADMEHFLLDLTARQDGLQVVMIGEFFQPVTLAVVPVDVTDQRQRQDQDGRDQQTYVISRCTAQT